MSNTTIPNKIGSWTRDNAEAYKKKTGSYPGVWRQYFKEQEEAAVKASKGSKGTEKERSVARLSTQEFLPTDQLKGDYASSLQAKLDSATVGLTPTLKETRKKNMPSTEGEKSAARIGLQDWLPDDYMKTFSTWKGSPTARQDSLNLKLIDDNAGGRGVDETNPEALKRYIELYKSLPTKDEQSDSSKTMFGNLERSTEDSIRATQDAIAQGENIHQVRKANREASEYYNQQVAQEQKKLADAFKEKTGVDIQDYRESTGGTALGKYDQIMTMLFKAAEQKARESLMKEYGVEPEDIMDL